MTYVISLQNPAFQVSYILIYFIPQERSKVNFLTVDGTGSEEKPLKIPKEVWILVNHLYTKASDQVRTQQLS